MTIRYKVGKREFHNLPEAAEYASKTKEKLEIILVWSKN